MNVCLTGWKKTSAALQWTRTRCSTSREEVCCQGGAEDQTRSLLITGQLSNLWATNSIGSAQTAWQVLPVTFKNIGQYIDWHIPPSASEIKYQALIHSVLLYCKCLPKSICINTSGNTWNTDDVAQGWSVSAYLLESTLQATKQKQKHAAIIQ